MLRSNHVLNETRPAPRRQARWPAWVGYAAAVWSLAYGALGLYWTVGGAGFPFGKNDPQSQFSIFASLDARIGAPVLACLGLLGAGVALATVRAQVRGVRRVGLLAFSWTAAVVLLLVVPDARALVAVAYAPVALIGALIGWLPDDYRKAIPWPVLNQFLCLSGGFLWAATALAYHLRASDWFGVRGDAQSAAGWTTPGSAARWGRWPTWVAATIPLVYAATRWAWALGIPLGIDERILLAAQTVDGGAWAGAALGTVAICGAALTLGLQQGWGETFPRWLPLVAGRSVPPLLAIAPATLVSVLVTAAGLMIWRRTLLGTGTFTLFDGNWAALAPELLWPGWGVALAAATLAYYFRRRGTGAPTDTLASPNARPGRGS
jgi:hypothetical protein